MQTVLAHGKKEKIKDAIPPHGFIEPVFDPDKTRALVEMTVQYADWSYAEMFGMVQEGDRWRLRFVCSS